MVDDAFLLKKIWLRETFASKGRLPLCGGQKAQGGCQRLAHATSRQTPHEVPQRTGALL